MKNRAAAISRNSHSVFPRSMDATVTTLTNLLLAALGMLSGVAAARLLGPGGRGELSSDTNRAELCRNLGYDGDAGSGCLYSAREPKNAGTYLGSGIALALLASIPFMVVAYALMPWILSAQRAAIIGAARWYLWIVVLYATVGMLVQPLRGRNDFVSWNALRLIVSTSWLSVLALCWLMNRRAAPFVASANLLTTFLLSVPFSFIVFRRVPGPYRPESRHFGEMTSYGLPCMMTGVPQLLNFRLDQILMAAFLAPRALGLYAVAVSWSGAVAPLVTGIGSVMLPSVASMDNREYAIRRFVEGVSTTSLLAFFACAVLTVATPLGIHVLFGTNFGGSIPSAIVLMPAAGILGINFALEEGLRGLGHPHAVLWAELFGLLVTACALGTMLRPLGIVGAAFASLLGYSAVAVSLLIGAKRIAGISPLRLVLPRLVDVMKMLRRVNAIARSSRRIDRPTADFAGKNV